MTSVNRVCPVCEAVYFAEINRLKHGRQTTCSRTCSYKLRGDKLNKSVQVICSTCKAGFTRSPAQIHSKHDGVYCSRACHYAGRGLGYTDRIVISPYVRVAPVNFDAIRRAVETRRARNNHRHSDLTIARLREATATRIAEGQINRVSKLEYIVADVLSEFNVGFQHQYPLRDTSGRYIAVLDFMLDDGRALEVNGTFWHADSRFYPDGPVYTSQHRTAERWSRKLTALEILSIPLVCVWESDLREDATKAVLTALGML